MVAATVEKSASAGVEDLEEQKRELERQMEQSRESIAHTVSGIKDAVVDEYQSIKQGVTDTLDWREHFRKHPVAWVIGALSIGYVVGNSVAAAHRGTKKEDELLSYLAAIGERFTGELSKRGMSILAPTLTGTVLVPLLTSQLEKTLGIDLSDLPRQLLAEFNSGKVKNGKGKKKGRKKNKSRKGPGKGKKKRSTITP